MLDAECPPFCPIVERGGSRSEAFGRLEQVCLCAEQLRTDGADIAWTSIRM